MKTTVPLCEWSDRAISGNGELGINLNSDVNQFREIVIDFEYNTNHAYAYCRKYNESKFDTPSYIQYCNTSSGIKTDIMHIEFTSSNRVYIYRVGNYTDKTIYVKKVWGIK